MAIIATMIIEDNNTFNFDVFPLFERAQNTMKKANRQIELCEKILKVMTTIGRDTTVTEIQAILNERKFLYEEYTNQKISAMLKKLIQLKKVNRKVINTGEMITVETRNGTKQIEKKITLFSLA